MAILRGGTRIKGFDIRLGLPRDRSLENVANDPRFRERPQLITRDTISNDARIGETFVQRISEDKISNDPRFKESRNKNKESVMGRAQSYINESEGFARKARFYVEFKLPRPDGGILENRDDGGEQNLSQASQEELISFKSNNDMLNYQNSHGRRVNAFCSAISMPEREVVMKETKHGGPPRKFAIDFKSAPINATFYTGKSLIERTYFELWQQAAFSMKSFNFNYYDNYVSDINIFQIGSSAGKNERDAVTYAVKLFDCYPKVIGPIEYSYAANEIQTFQVTFEFRYWINYFIDRGGKVTLGQSDYPDVQVTPDFSRANEIRTAGSYGKPDPNRINERRTAGTFGAPISGLPPELRRAGSQVLEQLKRSLPTGRIFGGRVFPPFF